jgi:nucleotide-binding universal stress UspA family protein
MIQVDEEEDIMPKTLLVPIDGSHDAARALLVAEQLAERFGADVVEVAVEFDGEEPDQRVGPPPEPGHGGRHRTETVRSVSVPEAIRAVALDSSDPVVCMATHARTTLGHALWGSIAEDVVREVEIPAVLVGPVCSPTVNFDGPLLLCIDGSPESNAIVPIAREWALALDTRIVLVHVFHPLDVETATGPEVVVAAAIELLGSDVEVETRVIRGYSPETTIRGLIKDLDPALVALATHGRTGLARTALGSAATAVVRHSTCPALLVRPRLADQPDSTSHD